MTEHPVEMVQYYKNLQQLFDHHMTTLPSTSTTRYSPLLPSTTGPQTISLKHTGSGNYFASSCHIHSGGSYNHKRNGHIFLFNLKLVVEFPAGSDILIPSGALAHGNTPFGWGRHTFPSPNTALEVCFTGFNAAFEQ
jgi:hypothetical protein